MTSVERMLHYTRLDQEPPTVAEGGGKPPEGWPSAGRIEFRQVVQQCSAASSVLRLRLDTPSNNPRALQARHLHLSHGPASCAARP